MAVLAESPLWGFEYAAADVGLPAVLLRKLVRDGVLRGEAPWRARGVVGTCDIAQARTLAVQLAAARAPVEGNGILATEAAGKYGFHRDTLYKWLKGCWVAQAGTAPNGDLLLNEGDIAFARALADLVGQQQGKPVFPPKQYERRT